MAHLCFTLESIPDLSLSKYASLDESGVAGVLKKTGSFLRQLNRKGILSKVFFHLVYTYSPDADNGRKMKVLFIASGENDKLLHTRELIQNSAISSFYDFVCHERVEVVGIDKDADGLRHITLRNHLGHAPETYPASRVKNAKLLDEHDDCRGKFFVAKISGGIVTLQADGAIDENGLIKSEKQYDHMAALGKREFFVQPSVILPDDNDLKYYKVAEWDMSEEARLYNMFKLMQGFDKPAAFRLDIFSVDYATGLRGVLPIQELRKRTSMSVTKNAATMSTSRDENADETLKQYNDLIESYESTPHFRANILAFCDDKDIAELIVDAAGAEALEGGSYTIKTFDAAKMGELHQYTSLDKPVDVSGEDAVQHLKFMPNLFLLDELRPFFSFPALHDGEVIQVAKETAPPSYDDGLYLGVDDNGYDVILPLALLKKHAFLAGVPGSGKTNSMLHLSTSLWVKHNIPFLILEPAKKEYRALARIEGMEELRIFSPSSGTHFPLHINPFEFPHGMSLSEHIRNLMAVFEGAFALVPPAPFMIDNAIESVYRDKGWYPDTINSGKLAYPSMSELYHKLAEEVEKTDYDGEIKGNLRSVLQVRIGSLLRREMGDVFDVPKSTLSPEQWLDVPVLIELEAMGSGPANFLTLLLSTLIRESLKVKPPVTDREIRHVIFFEEAHNLIGPEASEVTGEDADPKLAATAYVVKMLAEVRALNEGIIIADQLPTVMAPEVIKNTGLKIGHRLTAEDDRNLLGGTMSANGTQLEQMATFLPGEALMTFEGLLRPFKAQIAKWQRDDDLYNPPSNEELAQIMSEKIGYQSSMRRSSQICIAKFSAEESKIRQAADGFMAANDRLTGNINELTRFLKDHNISKEEFWDGASENPLVIKAQETAIAIEREKQGLDGRLDDLLGSINELLVKEKGYLLQNASHRDDVMTLLLELAELRDTLFEAIKHNFVAFEKAYLDFSDEMRSWELSKLV